ncbi:dynamin-like protein [Haloferula helveola]|uniref:Dynamin-like protein n=1 Tax=Haloferula helveola TaxID=490095 RepID=A0ABM7RL32_9BACT|nr:dynamin-like protein [Haloferula helveola]
MLGERYFQSRDRLLGCCRRIDELAEASGIETRDTGDEARRELSRPLRIVALGEVNAGKSTLLNALAGAELCPAGPLPTTQRTGYYRYSSTEREVERDNGWVVVGRDLDFLRHFELIDTPGTNSGWRDSVFADSGKYEAVDLLLVVFPSGNTWTAATWELISQLSEEALDKTALVVQQADLKGPEDLQVIDGHMRELCQKKIGRDLPILAVAAGLALEAKLDPESSRKSWSASRFSVFEEFVTSRLCESERRRYLLDRTSQEAANHLREIEAGLDRQKRGMDDDGWFLAGIEREANQLRDLILESSPKTLAGARGRYENEVGKLARRLGSMLGAAPTSWRLFFGDSTAAKAEARLADGLREAIRDFAAADAERLLEECEGHWNDVRPRVVERMGLDPGEPVVSGEAREGVVARFTETVGKSVTGVLSQLRVRASLDAPLRSRNGRLKFVAALTLALLAAAGICGTLGLDHWPHWLLLGAAGMAGIYILMAWTSRIRIAGETRQRLRDASGRFESAMRGDYAEAVRGLFVEYSNGLIGVRRQLAERQATLKPRSEQWDRLYLELKSIEQEMG